MKSTTTRVESTLLDRVGIVDDHMVSAAETASVVRYVLGTRRARFAAVPLIEALRDRGGGQGKRGAKGNGHGSGRTNQRRSSPESPADRLQGAEMPTEEERPLDGAPLTGPAFPRSP